MGWKKAKTKSFPTPRPCPSPRAGALAQSRRSIASSQLSCRRPRRIWDDVANLTTEAKGEQTMKTKNYTTSFTVDQSPEEVFDAINNVRGWWSEEIDGSTDKLCAEFKFHHKDIHRSTQKITELVPGKKVVWHVSDSQINFVKDKTELRFTHVGLVPAIECYGDCSGAWGFLINESLRSLITAGKGQPNQNK